MRYRNHFVNGLRYITLLFLLLNFSTPLFSLENSDLKYVAITDIVAPDLDKTKTQFFTDRLSTELFKTKAFRVVERNQISEILEEQDFQQTDCVAEECAVQIGQLLGVSYMLTWSMSKIGKTYSIILKLIDVATGVVSDS